jgi:hypothetical protein
LKKFDFIWAGILAAIVVFLAVPDTRHLFEAATKAHPYIMGFVKVAILATMGELLALRIVAGDWKKPAGFVYRVIIWGLIGMSFVIVFKIFFLGVTASQKIGFLPSLQSGFGATLLTAFMASAFMNLIFAPTFMALHRVTDTFIDLGEGKLSKIFNVKLKDVVGKIDWIGYITFVVAKTIPIFWIPAHTVTFLLPPQYQVLMAAFLSIALGGILAFSKKKATKAA